MDSNSESNDLNGGAADDGASDISSDEDSSDSDNSFETFGAGYHFNRDLQRVRDNDPNTTALGGGNYDFIQNISNEQWEEIGRDISNNTHLKILHLYDDGTLNDEKISYLFRGLTRSSSIQKLWLRENGISVAGVRSMILFLQHANNLRWLNLEGNNIQSSQFNLLLRALLDSPIEKLDCSACGIDSIDVDMGSFPRHLTHLYLPDNNINADGCRGLAKLLQGGDSTLTYLNINRNMIDDEGIAILVDALRNNTSLKHLYLFRNNGITKKGLVMILKLVSDISSVNATLESNHSLSEIFVVASDSSSQDQIQIQQLINMATEFNRDNAGNSEETGSEKVIGTQLRSETRAELAQLQGVHHSLYSEINPLHLPEVLSLVGHEHGLGELYVSLKSSIAGVISVVDRRRCIIKQLAHNEAVLAQLQARIAQQAARSAELRAELAELDASDGDKMRVGNEACSNKRHRSQ